MTKTIYLFLTVIILVSCQGGGNRRNNNKPKTKVTKSKETGHQNGQTILNPPNDTLPKNEDYPSEEQIHNNKPSHEPLYPNDSFLAKAHLGERLYQAWKSKDDKNIDYFLNRGAKPECGPYTEDNKCHHVPHTWNDYMRVLFLKKWDKDTERVLEMLSKYKNTPDGPDDDDYNMFDKQGNRYKVIYNKYPYLFTKSYLMRDHAKNKHMLDIILEINPHITTQNLEFAMKMGIDIYEPDEYGYNALYRAAYYGCYQLIPFLESKGLKWDVNLNPLAKKYGNDDCVIIWSYDKNATEIPQIENDGSVESVFKSPKIFLRKGVDHKTDPDKIKCPEGLSIIQYCKKCDISYEGKRLIDYLVKECDVQDESNTTP